MNNSTVFTNNGTSFFSEIENKEPMDDECSEFLVQSSTAFGVIGILLFVIGTISNILICLVYKDRIMKTTAAASNQYFLVVCLALSDLLCNLAVIPIETIMNLTCARDEFIFSQGVVVMFNALWHALTTLSLNILLLMTLERLISVKFPFYQLKRRHVIYSVLSVTLYSLATFCFYYFLQGWSEAREYFYILPYWSEMIGLIANFLLPSFANVAIYLYLFRIATIQRRRIQQQTTSVDRRDSQRTRNRNNSMQKRNKLYQNVMLLFCVTWIPFLVYNLYTFVDYHRLTTCLDDAFDSFTTMLVFTNSAFNGLVYTVASKSFRQHLLRWISRMKITK